MMFSALRRLLPNGPNKTPRLAAQLALNHSSIDVPTREEGGADAIDPESAPPGYHFSVADFNYDLPDHAIAKHPLDDRSASKLLVACREGGGLEGVGSDRFTTKFTALPELLPQGTLLLRNVSKVVAARVPCFKATGGKAELFLLNPADSNAHRDPALALASFGPQEWECMIRGKGISAGDLLSTQWSSVGDGEGLQQFELSARVRSRSGTNAVVAVEWTPAGAPLAEALAALGRVPIPPYLRREPNDADKHQYQTVYARKEGSVAAPTAGLHFTTTLLTSMAARGMKFEELTLHVGAGTFVPVKASAVGGHVMHEERFAAPAAVLRRLAAHLEASGGGEATASSTHRPPAVAVGTTTLRSLESAYCFGARLLLADDALTAAAADAEGAVRVGQWEPYKLASSVGGWHNMPSAAAALTRAAEWAEETDPLAGGRGGGCELMGYTRLMICPGHSMRTVDGLLTNFHQPQSTLLMLVASLLEGGAGSVAEHYRAALNEGFRFLSFGDSSLFLPAPLFSHARRVAHAMREREATP